MRVYAARKKFEMIGAISFSLPVMPYQHTIYTVTMATHKVYIPINTKPKAMTNVKKYPRIGSLPDRPPSLAKKWISGNILSCATL